MWLLSGGGSLYDQCVLGARVQGGWCKEMPLSQGLPSMTAGARKVALHSVHCLPALGNWVACMLDLDILLPVQTR